jgi:hypothetical protein
MIFIFILWIALTINCPKTGVLVLILFMIYADKKATREANRKTHMEENGHD